MVRQSLPDLEQFDEALDRKIWSLADSRLALHQDLSATRRNVPKQIENSLTQLLEQESKLERHLVNEDSDVELDHEESDGRCLSELLTFVTSLSSSSASQIVPD